MNSDPAAAGFRHVYVHVPFCTRRCSYCDFAIAVRRRTPVDTFVAAVMAEVATRQPLIRWPEINTIYLGGGTPSKLGGPGIRRLLDFFAHQAGVDSFSTFDAPPEITIEANPEDVTGPAAEEWVAAGVSRVSLGVQSFESGVLRWMHRGHGPDAAGQAVTRLRAAGIRDISVDLIFALPDALRRDWARDLTLALALEPDHLSLYGLTVEPRTPLGRWAIRGQVTELPDEHYAEEFMLAHDRLTDAGFEHYEVSNYGRAGHRSRHNSAYWTGASYLGLGPSAHGFDGSTRRWNVAAYAGWLARVAEGDDPLEDSELLGAVERADEAVYLGLRTSEGLIIGPQDMGTVTPWIDEGWAHLRSDRLVLSPAGWMRLDSLAAVLTSARSRS